MKNIMLKTLDGTTPGRIKRMLITACSLNVSLDLSVIDKLSTPYLQLFVSASKNHGLELILNKRLREELCLYGIEL